VHAYKFKWKTFWYALIVDHSAELHFRKRGSKDPTRPLIIPMRPFPLAPPKISSLNLSSPGGMDVRLDVPKGVTGPFVNSFSMYHCRIILHFGLKKAF